MAWWKVLTEPSSIWGTPVSSETGLTSSPSWARWSRVPSVAKISMSSAWRPRANVVMPSRVATESSARNPQSPPPGARGVVVRRAATPWPSSIAVAYSRPIRRPAAESQANPTTNRDHVEASALGLLLRRLRQVQLPGPVRSALDGFRGPADHPDRAVRDSHAGTPPPPPLPGHVGVAVLDGPDHVLPGDRRRALRVRFHRDPGHPRHGPGHARVRPVPAFPAAVRGLRAPA